MLQKMSLLIGTGPTHSVMFLDPPSGTWSLRHQLSQEATSQFGLAQGKCALLIKRTVIEVVVVACAVVLALAVQQDADHVVGAVGEYWLCC